MTTSTTGLTSFSRPIVTLVQGTSRGIGLEFTRQLLDDSAVARVFATCRDSSAALELGALCREHGERLRVVRMDVSDQASIAAAACRVSEVTTSIDLLVNCAGLLHDADTVQPERRLGDVDPEAFHRSISVNALGPLLVAKHFERFFDSRERVVLANISARVGSISDNRLGGWYAYRASKAAQNMITRNLSIELRRRHRGVICVALHPGTVDTDLSRPFHARVPEDRLFSTRRAVTQLIGIIDSLTSDSNGKFYAWNREELPW